MLGAVMRYYYYGVAGRLCCHQKRAMPSKWHHCLSVAPATTHRAQHKVTINGTDAIKWWSVCEWVPKDVCTRCEWKLFMCYWAHVSAGLVHFCSKMKTQEEEETNLKMERLTEKHLLWGEHQLTCWSQLHLFMWLLVLLLLNTSLLKWRYQSWY